MPLGIALGLSLCIDPITRRLGILLSFISATIFIAVFFFVLPKFGSINSADSVITAAGPYAILINPSTENIHSLFSDPKKAFFILFAFLPFLFSTFFFGLRALIILTPDLAKFCYRLNPFTTLLRVTIRLALLEWVIGGCVRRSGKRYAQSRVKWHENCPGECDDFIFHLGWATICLPHSYNFLGRDQWGAFHFTNYSKSQKYIDLRNVEQELLKSRSISVEISNGAFSPHIGQRFDFRHFPSNKDTLSSVVLIDREFMYQAGYARDSRGFRSLIEDKLVSMEQCYEIIPKETVTVYLLLDRCS